MNKLTPKFKCPACSRYTVARILDTRVDYAGVMRRRVCEWCGRTWITKERIDHMTRKKE